MQRKYKRRAVVKGAAVVGVRCGRRRGDAGWEMLFRVCDDGSLSWLRALGGAAPSALQRRLQAASLNFHFASACWQWASSFWLTSCSHRHEPLKKPGSSWRQSQPAHQDDVPGAKLRHSRASSQKDLNLSAYLLSALFKIPKCSFISKEMTTPSAASSLARSTPPFGT